MKSNKNIYQNTPIAIIGIGCLFPKSSELKEYWRLIFHGDNGIIDVPKTHWLSEDYFDKDPKKPDHVYCKRGGFLSPVSFDPTEFGIPPASIEATDTSQLFALTASKMALHDSGYGEGKKYNKDKTSVILGITGTQELVIPLGARLGHPKWRKALLNSGISPEKTEEIIKNISDSYVSWQEGSFPGLLGNVVAGRICNRLDLGGTNCVVDAACASSMAAMHLAVMELVSGRSDTVLTGGIDTLNDIFMHMCFSKTHVLSPTGDARPFSKDADGTVLGEGVGILVLKRLDDAEKDNDKIYAVIKSIGSSSDGKAQSIYAPKSEGQAKALRMAYKNAGIDSSTIGLIEAHGTGTRVGDMVEFQSLSQVFGESNKKSGKWCALGSVKSMIGHTKAAAGAAGIIKTALSLYNKVLPPTLKADEPDPNLKINETPFYLNTTARPWFSKKKHPRRAGVSAFGFGGSNFHVVLEEYKQNKTEISWDGSVEIFALSASTTKELAADLSSLKNSFKSSIAQGLPDKEFSKKAFSSRSKFSTKDKHRLLLVIERSLDNLKEISDLFDDALNGLEKNSGKSAWNLKNIFYGGPDYANSEKAGKIGFMFPGQGSQYTGMGSDLVCWFPEALDVLETANAKYDESYSLCEHIYPLPTKSDKEKLVQEETLRRTDIAQPAIGAVSLSMLKTLQKFKVKPDAVCGHSYGELPALYAAGWIDLDTFFNLSIARGNLMAAASQNNNQNGAMLAVKAPLNELASMVENSDTGVILANRNSPEQGVLSGTIEAIDQADKICREKGYKTIKLPVSAAFHSDLVKDAQKPFAKIVKKARITPSDIPVFSNTTGKPYPHDSGQAKILLGKQILCPVDFVSEIENQFKTGVRTFIEIGPKRILTGLVKSILKDQDFHVVSMDCSSGKQFGITDLAKTLCHLASIGHHVDLAGWEHPVFKTRKQLMSIPISGANYRSESKQITETTKKSTKVNINSIQTETTSNENFVRSQSLDKSDKSIGTYKNKPGTNTMKNTNLISDALKITQEGLKSMQALQAQTAQAHEKFLETQTEANRMLQNMMENTQRLAEASLGLKVRGQRSEVRGQRSEVR
ncbi:MAG: acyltransferase domain-containing protein, partial [Deltaproteobacteria bacterium]|nr:acyltransferase domain-containing protein [Deltaproteobacteria bacterium]MBW2661443.1 acyltransferase domain-containing protein [Deltaproteobacteria bacterium]